MQFSFHTMTCRREACIAAVYFWPWLVHTPCWRRAYETPAWIYGCIIVRETADVAVISTCFPNNLFRDWEHIFSTIFIKNSQLFVFTIHLFNNKFKHPVFDFLFHYLFQLFAKIMNDQVSRVTVACNGLFFGLCQNKSSMKRVHAWLIRILL